MLYEVITDGDGIIDSKDDCPEEKGLVEFNRITSYNVCYTKLLRLVIVSFYTSLLNTRPIY